ncbi:MAG: right-handed parallel beta-helix repeat-containing protein [Planctomycetaceae bacterium]|nr:right-handed parallel beta-helix repeat-containing protein [Planctomycetaceae bacterium]
MQNTKFLRQLSLAVLCAALFPRLGESGVIYVDSRMGDDAADGRAASTVNSRTGPVRSLQRASRLICPGDSIVLANNGTPYYGSLSFVGPRHSGVAALPLQIIGNGAVISGARPIPAAAWREVGVDTWSVTPHRKTYAQLSRDGQTLPTFDLPWKLNQLPGAPANHWYLEEGRILLKTARLDDPREMSLELSTEDVGLTLLGVEYVVVRDVTFRHFRLDGIHAQDRCRNVVFDNVICEGNGRAGIAVGGTSRVALHDCLVTDNRRYSLLITERGHADVTDSELSPEPTVVK